MKTYLQAYDLWEVVNANKEPPLLRANPTIAQMQRHRVSRLRKDKLINVRRDLENLKIKETEIVKQYSDGIMTIVNNIRLLEDQFTDNRIVGKVIITFTVRYEYKISSLEDSRDLSIIYLSELINALYAQKQRRESR
ncbi:Integrase, catalytic core [Gossypium australe]|uniref:Integrase, catalytic core n=1 Tax=Gossypium australe TaxID=47621 RepID=A0A5B6WZS9_9ROSI|nr:Integrase, catalytic core [Gossypium australe]